MDLLTAFLIMILALCALCMMYIAPRLAGPLLGPLRALGADSDSLSRRVFPVLGFVGVLGIMLKLTLF